jgi:hypothetical protein
MTTLNFSIVSNYRTYQIQLRERNYPKFEGRYNAYVNVFGQLSGDYLGTIEQPLKMDVTADCLTDTALIKDAEKLIFSGHNTSIF